MPYPGWTEFELTLGWIKTDTRMWEVVFSPYLRFLWENISKLKWSHWGLDLQQVWNTPLLLLVWTLGSWFNPLCLRISSGSFFPKSNMAVGVKEIGGHQWMRVLKLSLEHPAPESSNECLITVLWYPQTNKKPHSCLLQHFKYFRSFSLMPRLLLKICGSRKKIFYVLTNCTK